MRSESGRKKERKRKKKVPLFGSLLRIFPWGMVYTIRELGFPHAHGILIDKTALQSTKRCTALQECLTTQARVGRSFNEIILATQTRDYLMAEILRSVRSSLHLLGFSREAPLFRVLERLLEENLAMVIFLFPTSRIQSAFTPISEKHRRSAPMASHA